MQAFDKAGFMDALNRRIQSPKANIKNNTKTPAQRKAMVDLANSRILIGKNGRIFYI